MNRKFRGFLGKLRVISTDDLGINTFTYTAQSLTHLLVQTNFTQARSTRQFLSVSFLTDKD